MSDRSRAIYRALASVLPRRFRQDRGRDLENAALSCIARERARLGRAGVALAWLRIALDTLVTAIALRWPRRAPRPGYWTDAAQLDRRKQGRIEALMDALGKDLLYALRSLGRQPGFTIVTILTLALGIGANTAIFSVVNGVLLRPLSYPEPDRLEFITTQFPTMGFDQFWVSPPEYLEFRDHNSAFSSVGAYGTGAVNFGTTPPTRPVAASVSPELMLTLGVRPIMGRWFTQEDSRPGAEPVTILSWELWQRNLGGAPSALDSKVMIDGASTRIVGIMPRGYDIHDQKIEVWQPLTIDPKQLPNQRGNHFLYLVGRLKPGMTAATAQADLERMLGGWAKFALNQGHVPSRPRHPMRIDPLKQDIVGSVRTALLVLQGAVAFVLLIACANLANLLLARAETRQREFAIRSALGAGRTRLLRQFVTEGLVLAVTAAIAGVGLAQLGLTALLHVNPDAIPRSADITLDWRVLTFTLVLAVVTGFVFGFAPLVHLSSRLASSLRDGARTTGTALRTHIRSGLVIAEVTLAVMLVAGAGLLVRSFVNLMHVDAGFNRSHLVTFGLVPQVPQSGTPEQQVAAARQTVELFNRLSEKLAGVAGVQHVTAISGLPPNRPVDANDTMFEYIPTDKVLAQNYPPQNVDYWQFVSTGYVETMGIPVVKGRAFEPGDVTGPPVVLVNETLVHHFFTDRDPIGQRIKPLSGNNKEPWFTIVGVLKDVKQRGVDAPTGTELVLLQDQLPTTLGSTSQSMNLVMRTTLPIDGVAPSIQRVVRELDPSLPIVKLQTMDDAFGEAVARPRFLTMLLGVFAGLALLLAAVGTYGVLSYLVTQRQQEIGIRMALGADRSSVLRLVFRQGLVLSVTGLAAGLAGSFALGRVLRALLFNVQPTDPLTLGVVAGVIALVALAACLVPAWRATRVNPLIVLRQQ